MSIDDKLIEIYDRLEQAGITLWPVQATALSYYCILGVVPFLALCFAIAKSFGLEEALLNAINSYFATFEGQGAILSQLRTFADNLISNYSGGLMAFVALALIFWSGYRILGLLEMVFGTIFGYHPPRRPLHKAVDYFAVMTIMPLVLVAAGGVNVYLTGLSSANWHIPLNINLSRFTSALVVMSPYLLWWLVMSWTYGYFSRGLARWRERLIGGLIAGVAFQLFQTFYLKIMFAISSYNAIYGSFAAIPLFMIWLYTGWVIVLGGGEVTRRFSDLFATRRYFFSLPEPATWRNTVILALDVMHIVIANYEASPKGDSTSFRALSQKPSSPMPALGQVINRLLAVGLIARVSAGGAGEGPRFIPSRSPGQLNDEFIYEALETGLMEVI
jgi:membrane protein